MQRVAMVRLIISCPPALIPSLGFYTPGAAVNGSWRGGGILQ